MVAGALDLALGRPHRAVAGLVAALEDFQGGAVVAVPVRAELVDAALAAGDRPLAEATTRQLAVMATTTGARLHRAHADFAARKALQAQDAPDAPATLRAAARAFAECGASLAACRARLPLARSLGDRDRGVAVTEARSALHALDRMGATSVADQAAALLRGWGVKGRTGPRDGVVLSRREQDVLALVAEGLSNAEIAERLFISVKTAGHHVSNILAKLGVRSRTEATAYALLHPYSPEPGRTRAPKQGRFPMLERARADESRGDAELLARRTSWKRPRRTSFAGSRRATWVSVWITYTGTQQGDFAGVEASGRKVRFTAWDLIRVREGKIAEITQYCDLFTIMSQIGALPTAARA